MAGLAELTDEALFYDKPEGRIVEVAARGAVLQKDAMAFYADTLPQLGWSAVGDASGTLPGSVCTIASAARPSLVPGSSPTSRRMQPCFPAPGRPGILSLKRPHPAS